MERLIQIAFDMAAALPAAENICFQYEEERRRGTATISHGNKRRR
jgi:hypothetical protein